MRHYSKTIIWGKHVLFAICSLKYLPNYENTVLWTTEYCLYLIGRHFISIIMVFISFLNNGKVHYAMPFEYRGDKVFFDIILEAYKEP